MNMKPADGVQVTPYAVPVYSHFQLYSDHIHTQLHMWHAVEVGMRHWDWTEAAYAWCDAHVLHAWSVKDDYYYFLDEADAIQFVLTILHASS